MWVYFHPLSSFPNMNRSLRVGHVEHGWSHLSPRSREILRQPSLKRRLPYLLNWMWVFHSLWRRSSWGWRELLTFNWHMTSNFWHMHDNSYILHIPSLKGRLISKRGSNPERWETVGSLTWHYKNNVLITKCYVCMLGKFACWNN
jgi:hypothetical protein